MPLLKHFIATLKIMALTMPESVINVEMELMKVILLVVEMNIIAVPNVYTKFIVQKNGKKCMTIVKNMVAMIIIGHNGKMN